MAATSLLEEAKSKTEAELARSALQRDGVPAAIIESLLSGTKLTAEQRSGLDPVAQSRVDRAEEWIATEDQNEFLTELEAVAVVGAGAAAVGTTVGVGVGVLFMIGSLISGLLGYLLVMKKMVLQCTTCRAVVAAS